MFLDLPFSRKCETEADYIGLLLMSKSCYDPEEAIKFWQKMMNINQSNMELSMFLSTHPSHSKRIENLRSWLTEAKQVYRNSDCDNFLFNSFNKTFKNHN